MLFPSHKHMPRCGGVVTPWLGNALMRITGWRFEGAPPDVPRLVLAVAPHTSNWDFVIGVIAKWALDLKLTFFGKHTLFVWPLSLWMRSLGGIPVDRSASHGVVGEMIGAFREREVLWFALAPEGTRKKVARFKSGFLHIAAGAEVPVVLIYFDYANRVIGFGPVLHPAGDVDADLVYVEDYYRVVRGKKAK
jgi:1-acyl-sn-glycerol-3-phosphate acyltransferase